MRNFTKMLFMLLIFTPILAFAKNVGVGGMATGLMDPVGVVADFIHTACILVGGAFLFASIVKYIEHRRSPTMVPISTVVFLIVAGLLLLAIPVMSYLTSNGALFSR